MTKPLLNMLVQKKQGTGYIMIVLVKKSNITLIILIFLLSIAVYSLNPAGEDATPASSVSTLGTVIVDAGHGGEDPGKVSSYSGVNEKDLSLSIAKLLANQLEEAGYRVIMTREEDKLVYREGTTDITDKRKQDLTRRKDMMDNSGADIVVSIHLNDFSQSKYYGAQVFYPPNSEKSKLLALCVQKTLREDVDPSNKREALVKSTPIVILRNLKTPTIIVECGFLSNQQEEQKLRSDQYQLRIARAIKTGIDEYYSSGGKENEGAENMDNAEPDGISTDGTGD
jgi:N-acetylmuramoyl-L-alanine amidase